MSAERAQLGHEVGVAAVDVVDGGDEGLPFGDQARLRGFVRARARLLDEEIRRQEEERRRTRQSQVSPGDRSAKIRTYNYPQNRISDHRINLTLYRLNEIMTGGSISIPIDISTEATTISIIKNGINNFIN